MTTPIDIERLARMCLAVDAAPDDTELGERYSAELEKLSGRDIALALFAAKLLSGRRYSIETDNTETLNTYRRVAHHLGAVCETCEDENGRTRLVFAPRLGARVLQHVGEISHGESVARPGRSVTYVRNLVRTNFKKSFVSLHQ